MAKYRKKPVVIEATQWHRNGDHPQDGCQTFPDSEAEPPVHGEKKEGKVVKYWRTPNFGRPSPCDVCGIVMQNHGWVGTLEGGQRVCPGDWIITGVKGEFYPCKPDIFELTYEPVGEG